MKPNSIKIDNVEYIRADNVTPFNGAIKIVVVKNCFVYVGEVRIEGNWVQMIHAKNICKWGTTKGLGELVDGPTPRTILHDVGAIQIPLLSVLHIIDADSEKWNSHLGK